MLKRHTGQTELYNSLLEVVTAAPILSFVTTIALLRVEIDWPRQDRRVVLQTSLNLVKLSCRSPLRWIKLTMFREFYREKMKL